MSARFEIGAVLLAAGLGTRMAPLTEAKPKPLLLYRGKPLIGWTLDAIDSFVSEAVVMTRVFPRQFDDLPLSYPRVRLFETAHANMIGAFWDGFGHLGAAEYVFCASSDVAYLNSAVAKGVEVLQHDEPDILVALKTAYEGGEKKWHWQIEGGLLRDIVVANATTAFERFFMICKTAVLRRHLGDKAGLLLPRLPQYAPFGEGWVYLVKRLLDSGVQVRVLILNDEYLHNVNRVEDLAS